MGWWTGGDTYIMATMSIQVCHKVKNMLFIFHMEEDTEKHVIATLVQLVISMQVKIWQVSACKMGHKVLVAERFVNVAC